MNMSIIKELVKTEQMTGLEVIEEVVRNARVLRIVEDIYELSTDSDRVNSIFLLESFVERLDHEVNEFELEGEEMSYHNELRKITEWNNSEIQTNVYGALEFYKSL